MLDDNAWDAISNLVSEKDFYQASHRTIFRCMTELVRQNSPLDVITLSEALDSVGELENCGGMSYISALVSDTASASNIRAYAKIVQERAAMRALISIGQKIADSGFDPQGKDSATLMNEAEALVFQFADDRPSQGGPAPIQELLDPALNRIQYLWENQGELTGITTGFGGLDKLINGLQPADLLVVAGRPSMGKTALMMNMAEAAAMKGTGPVVVFSMEMSAESLVFRIISSLGTIDLQRVRTGDIKDDEWPRLTSTVTMLTDKRLFIDDTPALTPGDIRSRARRLAREHNGLGLIVVDYLQLMQVAGTVENRTGEISEISRSLKSIAKEFNCPLLAGSQLNRSLEQRQDKRPLMSDLRESGAIEQDADIIMAIYRDEVYNDDSPNKGIAEVNILKHRNGPTGRVELAFRGQYTRFDDLAHQEDPY